MKKTPQTCSSELCCKATASLECEIEQELTAPDKSLADLLDSEEDEQND